MARFLWPTVYGIFVLPRVVEQCDKLCVVYHRESRHHHFYRQSALIICTTRLVPFCDSHLATGKNVCVCERVCVVGITDGRNRIIHNASFRCRQWPSESNFSTFSLYPTHTIIQNCLELIGIETCQMREQQAYIFCTAAQTLASFLCS